MKLRKLTADCKIADALDFLRGKHGNYLQNVSETQLKGKRLFDLPFRLLNTSILALISKLQSDLIAKEAKNKKKENKPPAGTRPVFGLTQGGDTQKPLGTLAPRNGNGKGKQIETDDDYFENMLEQELEKNMNKGSTNGAKKTQPLWQSNSKNSGKSSKQVDDFVDIDDDDNNGKDEYDNEDFEEVNDDDDEEVDYNTMNLNKLTTEELQKHKDKMNSTFQKNFKKPGDPGYVYDKQVEFVPNQDNEWDLEDDF